MCKKMQDKSMFQRNLDNQRNKCQDYQMTGHSD